MRIGIITQPLANNYGGILQNYALQQVLFKMGHQPITIDQFQYAPKSITRKIISEIKNTIQNLTTKGDKTISMQRYEMIMSQVSPNTKYFIDKYINHTNPVYGYQNTRKLAETLNLDAYIVGSDQVWRRAFNSRLLNCYLDFTKGWNVKRIAYAASWGLDKWEFQPQETEVFKSYIKLFDAVSVRESLGVTFCKNYLDIDAKHVLDPTMLIDKEEYINLIKAEREPSNNGNLFCYILDPNLQKNQLIQHVEKQLSLHHFTIMPKERFSRKKPLNMSVLNLPTVTKWLKAFDDAKFIITDSFHGVVFSIIFNKPFWVILNQARGAARFDSILSTFGLNNRIVSFNNYSNANYNENIDWIFVNRKLSDLKVLSMDFINNNLKCNNSQSV